MKLTKSQRVKTIADIAQRLESEDWTTIDLVLKQFGFPVVDQWSGDQKSYIISIIGDSSDADLVELGQHFGMQFGEMAPAPPAQEPTYWQGGKLKVFLSHISAEREQAAKLQAAMGLYGMSAFVAHNDIHPTEEWQIELESALSTCDLLVALVHPDFIHSAWCDQEIGYALGRGIPVFTVGLGAAPHGFVSRFQSFSGKGKIPTQIASELFNAALSHKKLQGRMADVVIDLFVESGSFSTAKERVSYVEQLKIWDPSYTDRIKKALKDNSQIYGSWGVPEQIAAILEKWK